MKITLLTGKTFNIAKAIGFPIEVICSSKYKRLGLRIDAQKRIAILNVPKFCSTERAVNFAQDHQDWIDEHLQNIPIGKDFAHGDEINFLGKKLAINHDSSLRSGVFCDNQFLYVSGKQEFLSRRVKDFIKQEAHKFLLELSQNKAAQIGCKVNRIVLKDTKSRWGSCSSLNNINYNWRIALAPIEVIDYLVSHEVAHLYHHNHSPEFWQCVLKLCPKAEACRQWLKAKGKELYLIS